MLTKVLEDIALAGVMGYVEVGSWLLAELVAKLKIVVKQMTPLVTKDFYLPAPPLFCPQPTTSDKIRQSLEVEDETRLRQRASSIIQLALCVMNAAHLSIPAAAWYVRALQAVQQKATQFKITTEGPCLDLPDVLYNYLEMELGDGEFPEDSEDPSVQSVQASFRDLCSLLCYRRHSKYPGRAYVQPGQSPPGGAGQARENAAHLAVPEADGRSVGDSLDMEEEGHKSVTFLGASPRGKSLSVYFHKQCVVSFGQLTELFDTKHLLV
ncbi:chromosome 5 open reading frame 42 [Plakobranchus ocellatus]|uniref:Chromosome 5 open reading frame 42 n=1 Tax=Plakobranchus ocellatus TaxID=259542 RepID=A0AAV4BRL7_9GAST|nr:chromosome 5 open reading frame 42 [Plakobranchus ocellatus]